VSALSGVVVVWQVDAMHAEVALRVDLQQKLYEQNDTMFSYVHELLKAQKKNSRTMKTHVISLQEELHTLQQERAVLVSQITEAQTTKEAIRTMEKQQEGLEQRILEAQNARRAAVLAGQAQTAENQVCVCGGRELHRLSVK
jgi:septal ring factor EnvC (AmiA/AmiB activator)